MMLRRLLPACCTAFLLVAGVGAAQSPTAASGAFTVAPLRLELSATDEATSLDLTNALDRTSAVQVRVFAWRQENGADRYAPSDDFIVSPSIFRMAPQSSQRVRLIRKTTFAAGQEVRYRVVIDQLPEAMGAAGPVAATRLQLTLPLFAGSETAPPAQIVTRIAGNQLLVTNTGGRTARIGALMLSTPDGRSWPVRLDSGRYVMGQSTISYAVPGFACADTNGAVVRVTGSIDRTSVDAVPDKTCP